MSRNIIFTSIMVTTIMVLSLLLASCGLPQSILPAHRMVIMIETTRVLNPDDGGVAAPLSVYFFQLKEVESFNSADFFSLYDKGKATLAASFITVSKVDLTPNTSARLTLQLKNDTKFVGIVAAYRDQDNTHWRQVIPVSSSWGREKWHLVFKESGIDTYHVYESGHNMNIKTPQKPNFDGKSLLPSDSKGPNMQYEVLSYKK